MHYDDGYLREQIPEGDPPSEEAPHAVLAELELLGDELGGDIGSYVRRSILWTYAVFEQMRLGNFELDLEYFPFPLQRWFGREAVVGSFGLFDPQFEIPGYGLILEAAWPEGLGPAERRWGQIHFRRLGRSFPIAHRRMETFLHGPPALANANSACWVSDNRSPNVWGILTSGHATNGVLGGAVPLANGQTGTLVRHHHPPVDAAFVATSPPSAIGSLRQLKARQTYRFPAAGLAVSVDTAGGSQSRHCVSVQNSMGVYNTWAFGIQVFLDRPCQPGDSGSLVSTHSGRGLAIYSGELRGARHGRLTHQTLGLGQHFGQAVSALDVSAWT